MVEKKRIFLGHASEDKPRVRELYCQLKARGLSPWLDAVDLIPGQNWRIEIPKAIRSACIFLACLSRQSVAKEGYVQREFRYALSAYADRKPGSIFLIPVRLDECEMPDLCLPELEINLHDLHWVNLFEPDGFERLVQAIEHTLGVEAVRPLDGPNPLNAKQDAMAGEPPSMLAASRKSEPEQMKPNSAPALWTPGGIFRSVDAPWCPVMIKVPAGTFLMGSPDDETGRQPNEGPQHKVTISRNFAIGCYPVTFEEYDHFCQVNGRDKPDDLGWGRMRRPVINVSHEDAEAYCDWLSENTDQTYRLPTEAEWEYTCRASSTDAYAYGDTIVRTQANYSSSNNFKTSEVGTYPGNRWGIYDMHGNIWEWCADASRTYQEGSFTDPKGNGRLRALRGGCWVSSATGVRSARRQELLPSLKDAQIGFRVAQVQGPEGQA